MNRPIQAADASNMVMPKPADNGNAQASATESPFSTLLTTHTTTTPTVSVSSSAERSEDGDKAVASILENLSMEEQAVFQKAAGETSNTVTQQAAEDMPEEAGLPLSKQIPHITESLMRMTGAVATESPGVALQGLNSSEIALLHTQQAKLVGAVPLNRDAQMVQVNKVASERLTLIPASDLLHPGNPATEPQARNTVSSGNGQPADTDFVHLNPRFTAALSTARLDGIAPGKGELFSGELNQLITAARGQLPDGGNLLTQGTLSVNNSFALDATSEMSLTPTTVRGQVTALVGHSGWDRAVGEQALWFISQNIKAASIRLNPAHLGPMEMLVTVDGDKANVAFASQSAIVREALESAIPRLREMLAENGLSLGDVNVSHRGVSDQRGHEAHGTPLTDNERVAGTESDDNPSGADLSAGIRTALGLVDYYV